MRVSREHAKECSVRHRRVRTINESEYGKAFLSSYFTFDTFPWQPTETVAFFIGDIIAALRRMFKAFQKQAGHQSISLVFQQSDSR